jgi:hypothetical protein
MIAPPEAVLQTSTGGRAFLLEAKDDARHVITAAHCLPKIPPAHPARYLEESTFPDFIGPLDGKADVWAECLFADVMSDLAVLGTPDGQELYEQALAFDAFVENRPALRMSTRQFEAHEDHPGFIFSLEVNLKIGKFTGIWLPCKFGHAGRGVWIKDEKAKGASCFDTDSGIVKGGMSGSPILDIDGAVVGVISTGEWSNPRFPANLPGWLLDEIDPS